MNSLEELINRIGDALLADDFTDSPEKQLLAEAFAHYCSEFNRMMQECRRLMLENKLLEAESYAANISPKLELQLKMLNFPDKNRFLQLCKQYGYKLPPKLMTNIYEEVSNITFTPEKDLANLLNYFRQLARTTDNAAKIRVLRKIVALAPERSDMKDILLTLEKQRQDELTAAAKEAICNKQFTQLADIQQEFLAGKWLIQPNGMVLKKIASVLHDAEVARLNIQAKNLLDQINAAYSNFDYPLLAGALRRWELLHQVKNLTPDAHAAAQVAEAAAYCEECRKEEQEAAGFEALLQNLEQAVKREAPQLEVEKLFNQAISSGRGIPDELEMRVRQYLNTLEDIRRRRRLLTLLIVFIVVAGMLAGAFFGIYSVIMNRREKEWAANIAEALAKEPARVAMAMLDKLADESPALRSRAKIKKIEAQVQEKARQEEEHRKQLRILVKRIKTELKDFERNKASIDDMRALALTHLVDNADKTLLQEVDSLYREQYDIYVSKVDEKFSRMVAEAKKLRQRYFVAISKNNLNSAGEILTQLLEMQELLMRMLTDVSPHLRDEHQQDISAISRLQDHFARNQEAQEKSAEYINTLRRTADAGEMLKLVKHIRTAYPDMVNGERFAYLLAQLKDIPFFAPTDESGLADSVFSQEYALFLKQRQADEALRKRVLEYLQKNTRYYAKNPFYALILAVGDRKFEFYFQKNRTYVRGKGKVMMSYDAEIDDRSNTERVMVEVDESNSKHVVMTVYNDNDMKETYFASPVWPDDLIHKNTMFNYTAPHVMWFKDMTKKFSALPAGKLTELAVAQEICRFLRRDEVTCQARISIGIVLLKELHQVSGNPRYKAMGEALQLLRDREMQEVNWRKLYLNKYRSNAEAIAQKLNAIGGEKLDRQQQNEVKFKLYSMIFSNLPRPAGFVVKGENGLELAGLLAASPENSGELWAASRTAPYFRVVGSFKGRTLIIPESEKAALKEFQLLYTPGRSDIVTAKLAAETVELARQAGDNDFTFPQVWPQQLQK